MTSLRGGTDGPERSGPGWFWKEAERPCSGDEKRPGPRPRRRRRQERGGPGGGRAYRRRRTVYYQEAASPASPTVRERRGLLAHSPRAAVAVPAVNTGLATPRAAPGPRPSPLGAARGPGCVGSAWGPRACAPWLPPPRAPLPALCGRCGPARLWKRRSPASPRGTGAFEVRAAFLIPIPALGALYVCGINE